jgi:hypothetical protein
MKQANHEETSQEVWITLRFKGSLPLSKDAHEFAKGFETPSQPLSKEQLAFLKDCHTAELIEVEEEAEIYDTTE